MKDEFGFATELKGPVSFGSCCPKVRLIRCYDSYCLHNVAAVRFSAPIQHWKINALVAGKWKMVNGQSKVRSEKVKGKPRVWQLKSETEEASPFVCCFCCVSSAVLLSPSSCCLLDGSAVLLCWILPYITSYLREKYDVRSITRVLYSTYTLPGTTSILVCKYIIVPCTLLARNTLVCLLYSSVLVHHTTTAVCTAVVTTACTKVPSPRIISYHTHYTKYEVLVLRRIMWYKITLLYVATAPDLLFQGRN